MKNRRILILLIMTLFVMTLVGCGKAQEGFYLNGDAYDLKEKKAMVKTYVSTDGEHTIIVDYERARNNRYDITINGETYKVQGGATRLTVTYPDGSEAWGEFWGNSYNGGGALEKKPEVEDFWEILFDKYEEEGSSGKGFKFFIAIILLIVGIVQIKNPEFIFWFDRGWRYRNAEPSDLYLTLTPALGIIFIVIAGILLLTVFFG